MSTHPKRTPGARKLLSAVTEEDVEALLEVFDHDRLSRGTRLIMGAREGGGGSVSLTDARRCRHGRRCLHTDDLLGECRVPLAEFLEASGPIRKTVELGARPPAVAASRGTVTFEATFTRSTPGSVVRRR